ncbi:hypothetical protein [Streptomyces sp. 5-10]|uniref:hypothetical protein n=1 Tax=Streptomyces sp. 5-10 TaxID=878925 RepID=UPI00168AF195|nr:hypothetical protein [Streptomyces sp. 5-10]MBD3004871.1 hypothetical protein [Streptomyces sp. 5-10]
MIREDRFLVSRKPFAVDLGSLRDSKQTVRDGGTEHERYLYSGQIDAVWYRRKQGGVTYACLGSLGLWSQNLRRRIEDIEDPMQVLTADLDSRYGGDCYGRWDGERYWGSQKPTEQALHLALLEPMLANYPDIPGGYSGWWTFFTKKKR